MIKGLNGQSGIKVLGRFWLGLGILSTISGLFPLLVSLLVWEPRLPPVVVKSAIIDFVWLHYPMCALIQVVLASAAIFTATQFLRLRSWARPVLQGYTVMAILAIIVFGQYWLRSVWAMTGGPGGQGLNPLILVRYAMSAVGVAMLVIFSLVFGVCLWGLSHPAVARELCKGK
jgi:hypothetical protein